MYSFTDVNPGGGATSASGTTVYGSSNSVAVSVIQGIPPSGEYSPGVDFTLGITYYFMVLSPSCNTHDPVAVDYEVSLGSTCYPPTTQTGGEAIFQIPSANVLIEFFGGGAFGSASPGSSISSNGVFMATPFVQYEVFISAHGQVQDDFGDEQASVFVDPVFSIDPSYAESNVIVYSPKLLSGTWPQPNITGITRSGTNLVFNVANGATGGRYISRMSTNAAMPLSQWTPVCTNILIGSGDFIFTATNAVDPKARQQFYTIGVQ
jgi:hypothetical protein